MGFVCNELFVKFARMKGVDDAGAQSLGGDIQ